MRTLTRAAAAGLGVLLALLPVVATAQERTRTLERGDDWARVMILTVAVLVGILLLATLVYLYRAKRHIVWDFQQPASSHDDHH